METVSIGGYEYPLALTLEAVPALKEYGGISAIGKLLDVHEGETVEDKITDWANLLCVLANAGARQKAFTDNLLGRDSADLPELTVPLVMNLLSPVEIFEARKAMIDAVSQGLHREIKSKAKTKK